MKVKMIYSRSSKGLIGLNGKLPWSQKRGHEVL